MSGVRSLWLLLAVGLSAGLNYVTKPAVVYELGVGERTMSTGALILREGSQEHRFDVVSAHVVAADVPRLFASPLAIRALWIRSPEENGQPPDLELFVDARRDDGTVFDAAARDIADLRGRSLTVAARAPGGSGLSRVRFPGASEPATVVEGELRITEAFELHRGNPGQGFRIRAQVRLVLQEGDAVRRLEGELGARLLWLGV